jgi:hypothetical protein
MRRQKFIAATRRAAARLAGRIALKLERQPFFAVPKEHRTTNAGLPTMPGAFLNGKRLMDQSLRPRAGLGFTIRRRRACSPMAWILAARAVRATEARQ